jgi:hypothetical protein
MSLKVAVAGRTGRFRSRSNSARWPVCPKTSPSSRSVAAPPLRAFLDRRGAGTAAVVHAARPTALDHPAGRTSSGDQAQGT